MAVERVERRLRLVTAALNEAGIAYAVIGGNAVATWVGRVDLGATRATKDVDLLVRKPDLDQITGVMEGLGFGRQDVRKLVIFVDPDEPSKKSGVHLVWSDQLVRSSYVFPAPSVEEAVDDPEGFRVLGLPALVRMKLTSFRDIDRVHIADLLGVGLIDEAICTALPPELQERLKQIEESLDDEDA